MTRSLRLAIATPHPVALVAAAELATAWWRVAGGWIVPATRDADVTLRLSSLVRPSVVVDFARPFEGEAARAADTLGLTIAAWDATHQREAWRELSASLDALPHIGRPSPRRPWALSLNARDADGAQLHLLGSLPTASRGLGDDDTVWWPRLSRVAAPLLGHASVVLHRDGPLMYDALRAGVPCDGSVDTLPLGTLAGLVPPALLHEPRLWQHVAEQARGLREGDDVPEPLLTPAWVARSRDRFHEAANEAPSELERARRKLLKLQRDPRAFFRDSKVIPTSAIDRVDRTRRRVAKLRRDPKQFFEDSRFDATRKLGRYWPG